MNNLLFLKVLLLSLIFTVTLSALDTFKGIAKQDVNVRSMPDYESKVAYVLRKNQEVNIHAIIKTKNKGSWYKIDKGFVVIRFVETNANTIPTETFTPELLKKEEIPKKVETQEVVSQIQEEKQEAQEKEIIVQDVEQTKEQDATKDIKPIIDQSDEVVEQTKEEVVQETDKSNSVTSQEKVYVEPVVIKKEESLIAKYINFTYIIYGVIGIVVLILLIVLMGKLFSRPSITDQISQHQRRNQSLKKALSSKEEE